MQRMKFKDYGDGSGVWFTSDTHFGHAKVIEYSDRPFADIEEMNETLIANWNSVVKEDDIIYHLGDFAFGGDQIWSIAERLNGHKYLILGNHDEKNIKKKHYDMFEWVGYQEKIIIDTYPIYLNHFPFLTYGGCHREHPVLQLHGHLHMKNGICSETPEVMSMLMKTQYDVGVDNNGYFPVSWKQIKEKMQL